MAPQVVKQPEGVAAERKGLQLYLVNTVLGAVLGAFSKLAAGNGVPFFQLVLFRSVALVACTIPLLAGAGINPFAHHDRQWLLVLRGVFGFLSVTAWYWALALLPMSDVNALGFLAPMFVAVLAPYTLGEPAPRATFLAMPFSAVGVLFVAQPSWLFGARSQTSALGVLVGTSNALFSTGAKLTVRALAASNHHMADILFSFGFTSLLGSGLLCASMPKSWVIPAELSTYLYIGAACAVGILVQVSFTSALQKAKAAPAAVCDYFSMVWTLLADYFVFHKMPSTLSLCGSAVIVAASLLPLLFGGSGTASKGAEPPLPSAEGDEGAPLKASSSAEGPDPCSPDPVVVQLAKISKYLGKGKRTASEVRARCGSDEERVGLVAPDPSSCKQLGSEEELQGQILAATGSGEPAGGGQGELGAGAMLLHHVLMGTPNRTSSEKEAMLRLAGK